MLEDSTEIERLIPFETDTVIENHSLLRSAIIIGTLVPSMLLTNSTVPDAPHFVIPESATVIDINRLSRSMTGQAVFDSIDENSLAFLRSNPSALEAVNAVSRQIRDKYDISGIRLVYFSDPEEDLERVFVNVETSLLGEEALDLEDEIVESISDNLWVALESIAFTVC